MRSNLVLLFALAGLAAGCEPLRGVVSEKETSEPVDLACVDATLRKAFGKIERWDYASDGNGFSNGTKVAQFAYFHSVDGRGWATLEIGSAGSTTRIVHSFTAIGAKIPEQDFPLAFQMMDKAAAALQAICKLDLRDMSTKSVGQRVESLKHARPSGS